jgi:winged helix DNA-binding protein
MSLTDADIARWRLRSQRLTRPLAASAEEVVGHLLAVQAENPSQSAWAVAGRTDKPDPADLGGLLDSGAVLRTHVLRPTWHYVSADDIVWLIEVTRPRVLKVTAQQLTELDDQALDRATAAVLDSLATEGDLTRTQLAEALAARGVAASGHLLMILLAHLELQTLICSGKPADGQHTYALLSDRVPQPRRLERDEALAELARRYFTGHGPATDKDLAYWGTLTVTDVRKGLAAVKDDLASFEHDGRTYWHAPTDPPDAAQEPRGHLLQVLDEMYRGYQDSRYALDAAGLVPRTREPAVGMALVDGQLVAWMKRTLAKNGVDFALTPLRDLVSDEVAALQEAAERYGTFLGLPARLTV